MAHRDAGSGRRPPHHFAPADSPGDRLGSEAGADGQGAGRARLNTADGTSQEWRSEVLPRYARMTRQVEALIAAAYLSGTNTRRVRRALGALFNGAVSKDTVSRAWRKVQADWETWCRRSLAEEAVVRLILDGTQWSRCGWTARRRRSRYWWFWVFDAMGRRCRKTLRARAVAGESGVPFFSPALRTRRARPRSRHRPLRRGT
jgi:hypothetical protein